MDKISYAGHEIEFETIGGEHDIVQAQFPGPAARLFGRPLAGWGMSRREAAIDLLRAQRDALCLRDLLAASGR